jgi:hypothetical protein
VARLAFHSVGFFYVAQPSSYDVERTPGLGLNLFSCKLFVILQMYYVGRTNFLLKEKLFANSIVVSALSLCHLPDRHDIGSLSIVMCCCHTNVYKHLNLLYSISVSYTNPSWRTSLFLYHWKTGGTCLPQNIYFM